MVNPRLLTGTRTCLVLQLLVHCAMCTAAGVVDDGGGPAAGAVRLPNGPTAKYQHFSDRNALRDACRLGSAFVALTEAGGLLRFDGVSLRVTAECFERSPVTCLGRSYDSSVLVAFEDGRVCRIDQRSLKPTEIARVPGKPQWVSDAIGSSSRTGTALLAVLEESARTESERERRIPRNSIIYRADDGLKLDIGRHATTFLLDRHGRLWLGADNGEWGGWCSYFDAATGKLNSVDGVRNKESGVDEFWRGVYGFVQLRDGQVWSFGGTSHVGINHGFIWRVDQGRAKELYHRSNAYFRRKGASLAVPPASGLLEARRGRGDANGPVRGDFRIAPTAVVGMENRAADAKPVEASPDRPHLPITEILEDPRSGELTIISFADVFRSDTGLVNWKKVAAVPLHYRLGRPDAVGTYPSIRRVLTFDGTGKSTDLLFATRVDGLVKLSGGKPTVHVLSGQLGLDRIGRIETSSAGILVLSRRPEDAPWRFRDGFWHEISFAPPYEPEQENPDPDLHPEFQGWAESRVIVERGGRIVTVSSDFSLPGTRATSRWSEGKADVIGRETSRLNPSASFVTPDGCIWNAWSDDLQRFADGRWNRPRDFVWPSSASGRALEVGTNLRAIGSDGPPWVLLDPGRERLLCLSYDVGLKNVRLKAVKLQDARKEVRVRDAITWSASELLLATDGGLRTFALETSRIDSSRIDTRGRKVTRMCRDGAGRLWLGGDGLMLVGADGETVTCLDALPTVGQCTIATMTADPNHTSGIIAAVEGRGVVFVQCSASPDAEAEINK